MFGAIFFVVGFNERKGGRKLNSYLSKKIKYLSFFAMIGVVYCHAYNYFNTFLQPTTILAEGMTPGAMLQFLISNGLVRFAVPLFFAFSGYLFFYGFEVNFKGYLEKLGKRVRTILVPFLIWTALAGGFLYMVYMQVGLERFPIVNEKIGAMLEYGIFQWLLSSPAFQLWYLTDLFKLIIVSPIVYWLIKKWKKIPIVIFGVLWLLEISFFINGEGLLYFSLGAYFAIHNVAIFGMESLKQQENRPFKKKYKRTTYVITIGWIVGCIAYTLCSAALGNLSFILYVLLILYKVNVLLGITAVWRLYDLNAGEWQEKRWVKAVVSNSFFVYAMHEPLQHLLTQMLLEKMQFNGAHTMVYFLLPIAIICGCMLVSMVLRRIFPKLYGVMTGSRGNS